MTTETEPLTVNCPTCGNQVPWVNERPHRPFCSKRCRDSDFCDWANEEHVLAGDSTHSDVLSDDLE